MLATPPLLAQGKGGSSGGNMAALELVAMDMKAQGMYVCRTLSFAGGWVGGGVCGRLGDGWRGGSTAACWGMAWHGTASRGWARQGRAGQGSLFVNLDPTMTLPDEQCPGSAAYLTPLLQAPSSRQSRPP